GRGGYGRWRRARRGCGPVAPVGSPTPRRRREAGVATRVRMWCPGVGGGRARWGCLSRRRPRRWRRRRRRGGGRLGGGGGGGGGAGGGGGGGGGWGGAVGGWGVGGGVAGLGTATGDGGLPLFDASGEFGGDRVEAVAGGGRERAGFGRVEEPEVGPVEAAG